MPKTCNKEGCNNNVFGGGYCKNHQYLRPKKDVAEKKDRGLFVREISTEITNVPTKNQLDKWFKERHFEMPMFCENNCGRKTLKHRYNGIPNWRFSVAHIVPKSPTNGCPSVSCHENNCIYLCIQCHDIYDSNWDKAMKMPVWELAKLKAQTFIQLIPKSEYKKILDNFIN